MKGTQKKDIVNAHLLENTNKYIIFPKKCLIDITHLYKTNKIKLKVYWKKGLRK